MYVAVRRQNFIKKKVIYTGCSSLHPIAYESIGQDKKMIYKHMSLEAFLKCYSKKKEKKKHKKGTVTNARYYGTKYE